MDMHMQVQSVPDSPIQRHQPFPNHAMLSTFPIFPDTDTDSDMWLGQHRGQANKIAVKCSWE